MKFVKLAVPLSLVLFFTNIFQNNIYAQASTAVQRDYIPNHMFWGNMVILGKIKGKFNYQFDFEYRRQADPNRPTDPNTNIDSDHYNILKHPYQYAVRNWIHYQPTKALRFSISPFTWFGTWLAPVNGVTVFQPEFRNAIQFTLNQNVGRVLFNSRFRYEFRFFGTKEIADNPADIGGPGSSYDFQDVNKQGRFRYMFRALIPINHEILEKGTYYCMTSSELFLKTGKYVKNANVFDQNRFYLGLGFKFANEIRLETGYFNQTAFRLNNKAQNNVDVNHALFVNLLFDDFNSLFKKRKKDGEEN